MRLGGVLTLIIMHQVGLVTSQEEEVVLDVGVSGSCSSSVLQASA